MVGLLSLGATAWGVFAGGERVVEQELQMSVNASAGSPAETGSANEGSAATTTRAPQSLSSVILPAGETDGQASEKFEDPSPPSADIASSVPVGPSTRRPRRSAPDEAGPNWRALFDDGEYSAALELAEAAGFERLVASESIDDLEALADLARLTHSNSRAQSTLLHIRGNHSGTTAAARAAFDLGRLAVDDRGKARKWFRTYIEERPKGARAQDARGRILRSLANEGPVAERRAAARDYLTHHPGGPDADHARALLTP